MHTLGEMWSATEAKNKGAIQEQKIKCVYLAAEDGRADNGIREEAEEGMESRVMDESVSYAFFSCSGWRVRKGISAMAGN
jgi:hypothetical protein